MLLSYNYLVSSSFHCSYLMAANAVDVALILYAGLGLALPENGQWNSNLLCFTSPSYAWFCIFIQRREDGETTEYLHQRPVTLPYDWTIQSPFREVRLVQVVLEVQEAPEDQQSQSQSCLEMGACSHRNEIYGEIPDDLHQELPDNKSYAVISNHSINQSRGIQYVHCVMHKCIMVKLGRRQKTYIVKSWGNLKK